MVLKIAVVKVYRIVVSAQENRNVKKYNEQVVIVVYVGNGGK